MIFVCLPLPEAVGRLAAMYMTDELSDDLCVGVRLEHKSFACKKFLDVFVIGDNPIVNN